MFSWVARRWQAFSFKRAMARLKSPDPAVRRAALGRVEPACAPEVLGTVIGLLEDSESTVADEAARAIARLGDVVLPVIRTSLEPAGHGVTASAAVSALRHLRGREALRFRLDLLGHPSQDVRRKVAIHLMVDEPSQLTDELESVLANPSANSDLVLGAAFAAGWMHRISGRPPAPICLRASAAAVAALEQYFVWHASGADVDQRVLSELVWAVIRSGNAAGSRTIAEIVATEENYPWLGHKYFNDGSGRTLMVEAHDFLEKNGTPEVLPALRPLLTTREPRFVGLFLTISRIAGRLGDHLAIPGLIRCARAILALSPEIAASLEAILRTAAANASIAVLQQVRDLEDLEYTDREVVQDSDGHALYHDRKTEFAVVRRLAVDELARRKIK